jgi:hypothetical protein
MKVYIINSTIICLLLLPSFLHSRRFVFANEPYGTVFACYVYRPLVNVFYVFTALIDVAILLDRITLFTRKFDFAKSISLRLVCSISLICGLLIGGQFYAFGYPETLVAYLSQTVTFKFYFVKSTQFVESLVGSILYYIVLFIKDVLTAALVTTFNVISMILFKQYLTLRSKRFSIGHLNNNNAQLRKNKSVHFNCTSLSLPQSNANNSTYKKMNAPIKLTQMDEPLPTTSIKATSLNKKPKISRTDRSTTMMAIILSLISIVEHSLAIFANIFILSSQPLLAVHFAASLALFISIRHSLNLFILYLFNKNFRSEINGFFK